ncbi:cation:proton antiporter [Pelomicrobium methylotrophicum]|nr:cation:proton antiporter [Pelomicrobium methylotrophicum]
MPMLRTPKAIQLALAASVFVTAVWSVDAAAGGGAAAEHTAWVFLWIALILGAAKTASLVERFGQPAVLGELLVGIALGNLFLLGIDWFESIKTDEIVKFLAELGVVILLFQIGLESSVDSMRRVGVRAFLVAVVGVVLPFLLGTLIVGPLLLPGLSFNAYLFLGATLTATSVGITGRVFKDMGTLQTAESQIVLGAAVIDDVLGLVILAVVSAIVSAGTVDALGVAWIVAKAMLFLVAALVLGQMMAPRISRFFSRIHTGVGMKFMLVIGTCLVFAFLAQQIGLAPIVGAFAAGLILDEVQFRDFESPEFIADVSREVQDMAPAVRERLGKVIARHQQRGLEELVSPLGHFLVPFFFVITGMGVRLDALFNLHAVLIALGITAAAVVGKVAAGIVAGKVDKWLVGWGMVPRGEVGLIFAVVGKGLGVVSDEVFSVIVIMVMLTTLMTPPILAFLIKRRQRSPAA